MRNNELKRSQWESGIWVTQFAVILGLVAVGVGIKNPVLFQIKVVGFAAIGAIVLSIYALGVSLWRIGLRSRRLRRPLFWVSIVLNLTLIAGVGLLYMRGLAMQSSNRDSILTPVAPDSQ